MGVGRLVELASKLQAFFKDSRKFPVSAGLSYLFAADNLCVRNMKSQITGKELKFVPAVAVTNASKQDLDALKVRWADSVS